MANEVAAINGVPYGKVGAINGVSYGKIAAINHVEFVTAPPPDSISVNPSWLEWGPGEGGTTQSTYVTASGSWTASVTSDSYGIVTSYTASGSGSGTADIILDNATLKAARYAQITYTRGTATAIIDLCIAGDVSGTCFAP